MTIPRNMNKLLRLHEGVRRYAYKDSLGYWTIGVGHLIDQRIGGKIPESVIDQLLEIDINDHYAELIKALPWAAKLDEVRRAVLTDMAFNLGVGGLLKFKATLGAIQTGKWADAGYHMRASLWAAQVKGRATRLIRMIETGQWPVELGGPPDIGGRPHNPPPPIDPLSLAQQELPL